MNSFTAHQKLMLICHLERAERTYATRLATGIPGQFPATERALSEVRELLILTRTLKTEG